MQQPLQAKKRFPVKAPARRAQPAVVAPEVEAVDAPILVEAAPPVPPRSTARGSSTTAVALHAWLKPATLRQQFILTEVLQPPLAMREDRTLL